MYVIYYKKVGNIFGIDIFLINFSCDHKKIDFRRQTVQLMIDVTYFLY